MIIFFDLILSGNSSKKVTIERIILNANAHQKLSTLKPVTKLAAISIIIAFNTSKKRPKLNMVAGMVNNTSNGFRKVLSNDNTIAMIIAVK